MRWEHEVIVVIFVPPFFMLEQSAYCMGERRECQEFPLFLWGFRFKISCASSSRRTRFFGWIIFDVTRTPGINKYGLEIPAFILDSKDGSFSGWTRTPISITGSF